MLLEAGDAALEVDIEGGARVTRLCVAGFDLLTAGGLFVMAPWAGRTGDGRFTFEGVEHQLPVVPKHAPHAIHGTVRSRPWEVVDAGGTRVHLRTDLGPDWPWPGWCEEVLQLSEHGLDAELSLHAPPGGEPYPATMGWHPWFTKPAAVDLLAVEMLERGDDHLPTGRRVPPPLPVGSRPLDDCFEDIGWPVQLRWRNGFQLDVGATGCEWVVVFDEPADSTCVEPQTGPPNGLATSDHTIVSPHDPLCARLTLRWSARHPSR